MYIMEPKQVREEVFTFNGLWVGLLCAAPLGPHSFPVDAPTETPSARREAMFRGSFAPG